MTLPAEAAAVGDGTLTLERGSQRAAVAARGAALISWSVAGREHVSAYDRSDPSHAYDGATLMPWPNRLRGGRFAFGGTTHRVPVNEPARDCALHGLAAGVAWETVEHATARVRLRTQLRYPYAVEAQVTYELTAGGLEVELAAVNAGDESAPFGAGSHPYLHLPHGVDGARLELPAERFVPVDAQLLPRGDAERVAGTALDFRRARALSGVELDTCFGDLRRDDDARARVRVWPDAGAEPVELWLDGGFDFVHVYTADADPDPARRRTRLAVEATTCAPDAFNTGVGLIVLAPGREFRARWGLSGKTDRIRHESCG